MKKSYLQAAWMFSVVLALTIVGCEAQQEGTANEESQMGATAQQASPLADVNSAVAAIQSAAGEDVSGTVLFTETGDGIQIQADIEGLSEGPHGFHIHQYGDCTADDLTSAGGHYNPLDMPHGAPDDQKRHVGDLGNIEAGAGGNATYSRVDSVITFDGETSIIGHAVVIHGGEDDLQSQPSGDAGPRVGCGVIGIANPETSIDVSG